jgi:hypothetical protein
MIVISGCPRSGTSLMMLLHKEALGTDAIIGTQWMAIDPEIDDDNRTACINYIKDKKNPDWRAEQEQTKAMNPNGFWECPWTVRGIQWVQHAPENNKVCKIVSQGLANSNPQYIDKVVMMSRHPWSVANSHKDLKLNLPFSHNTRNKDIGNVSPNMYINVTYSVCKWILANDPDVMLVNYEDLICDPDTEINRLQDFVGGGKWKAAKSKINKKLQRNTPQKPDGENDRWGLALDMHNEFKTGNWQKVIDVYDAYQQKKKDNETDTDKGVKFFCPRWGGQVGNTFCHNCKKNDPDILKNLKDASEKRKIVWKNEPCLWDCGMNPDRESYTPLTIDQSIDNNHWCDGYMPVELTVSAKTKNAAIAITKGITSVAKTQILRKGRVSDDLYKERLNTCTNCPGNHAVFKNGALHTCGQFKDSITGKLPTCGCVLTKKARDESQNCPMGYWANLTIEGK